MRQTEKSFFRWVRWLLSALALAALLSGHAQAACTPSADGASIPPLAALCDNAGGAWTVESGVVKLNGQNAGYSARVNLLLWYGGAMYHRNMDGGWWKWSNNNWASTTNPRPTSLGFSISNASAAPTSANPGQTVNFNATLTSNLNVSGINVYFEIFDGTTKVAYKEFYNQYFQGGAPRSFNWAYAIPATLAPKAYTLKLAVYNANWSSLLAYKDLGTLNVTAAPVQGFTISNTSFSPTSVSPGQNVTLNSTLTSGANASGINVYFEVFDGATKVAFKEFANQSFSAGVARAFNWTYAVPATLPPKAYTLKIAVYNANWTTLLAVKELGTLNVVGNLAFAVSNTSFSPASASAGQTVTMNSTLTANMNASGVRVYFEIFDGATKVTNREFANESFTAGVARSFSWPYVIPSNLPPKSYLLKLAVYNADWSKLLAYADIGTLTVTAGTPTTGRLVPAGFFGMHVGAVEHEPWPTIPFDAIRSWDSWPGIAWHDIQPSRGTYDWSHLDAFVNQAASQRVNITYTFGYVPAWASTNPTGNCDGAPLGSCYPPNDADWKEFVTQLTNRYRGRIHNYELWNEPNAGNFYKGTYAQLANMEKLASPIVRAAGAKMIGPSPQGPTSGDWLNAYFAAGGGANADAIAFHSYLYGPAENILPLISSIRSAMISHGLAGKPIWDTEHSWGAATDPDGNTPEKRVAWLARQKVLSAASGIEKSFWYLWDSIGPHYFGQLFDRGTKTLLPPGTAHREVRNWLVDATIAPCSNAGTVYQCKLTRSGGYEALIVWNTAGSSNFTPPAGYMAYKTLTGARIGVSGGVVPIGIQPVMIEKPGV